MAEPTISWDQSKFDRALTEYLKYTSRTLVQALNTKGYYIARRALFVTAKVNPARIKAELGRFVFTRKETASGRISRRRTLELAPSRVNPEVSLAEMILIARYRKKGGWPKNRREMDKRIRDLVAARLRSVAFIKSGWLPAIRALAPVADRSGPIPLDNAARQYGAAKGRAIPAGESADVMVTTIENSALGRPEEKQGLQVYGARGLQQAFDHEAASMIEYIEGKLAKGTAEANRVL